MLVVVAPVLHPYVSPPDAVRVALPPLQTVVEPVTVMVGVLFTVIVATSASVHPFPSVTVSV